MLEIKAHQLINLQKMKRITKDQDLHVSQHSSNEMLSAALPVRVQRKRSKGWKMPPNTVYVGRGTKWGNPYKVVENMVYEKDGEWELKITCINDEEAKRACIELYTEYLLPYKHGNDLDLFFFSVGNYEQIVNELKGKNLACFCPLSEPCHADILLRLANG